MTDMYKPASMELTFKRPDGTYDKMEYTLYQGCPLLKLLAEQSIYESNYESKTKSRIGELERELRELKTGSPF